MAEYQECDFSEKTDLLPPGKDPIPDGPKPPVFVNHDPERRFLPCDFCNFYASSMCQGCDYYSACVGSITGDSYGGDLTKEEATAFADRIYDDWERDNYRKDYPRTWRIRLALHRLYGRVFRVWHKYRSWKIKRELAKKFKNG